jgi:uncharacterized protein
MADNIFEWDDAKAETNYRKHGVDFETATEIFADPFAIEDYDVSNRLHGEDRSLITGVGGGVLLTVIYTERSGKIRIISARRATKKEHDDYYIQNSQK